MENSRKRRRKTLISEINVTPMVDVMLVLLIIFMVTAPMLVASIKVDLPKTNSEAASEQFKPLVITINKQGKLFLFESKIEQKNLVPKLQEITKENTDTRIFVRGDKNVSYGTVVNVIAHIQNSGFTKVALVSDIKQK